MAHESIVWTLAFHPLGHILCSGSNDHTVKFWTRNRPGDQMRDKYNLNTLPASLAGLDEYEMDDHIMIPGMGIEDNNNEYGEVHDNQGAHEISSNNQGTMDNGIIPGLDLGGGGGGIDRRGIYTKPIPKSFQAQWNVENIKDGIEGIMVRVMEKLPGIVQWDVKKSDKITVYGKEFELKRELNCNFKKKLFMTALISAGTKLHQAMMAGFEALFGFIQSGKMKNFQS